MHSWSQEADARHSSCYSVISNKNIKAPSSFQRKAGIADSGRLSFLQDSLSSPLAAVWRLKMHLHNGSDDQTGQVTEQLGGQSTVSWCMYSHLDLSTTAKGCSMMHAPSGYMGSCVARLGTIRLVALWVNCVQLQFHRLTERIHSHEECTGANMRATLLLSQCRPGIHTQRASSPWGLPISCTNSTEANRKLLTKQMHSWAHPASQQLYFLHLALDFR